MIQEEKFNPIDKLLKINKQIFLLPRDRPNNLVKKIKANDLLFWKIFIIIRQNPFLKCSKINLERERRPGLFV
jgi:hypothetical protein